jgi:hypothetical protein
MKTSIKKILTFSVFAVMAFSVYSVTAQEDEAAEESSGKMTAVFVNEHPRDEITLYWVNPDSEEDDPERFVSCTANLFTPIVFYWVTYGTKLT